MKLFLKKVLTIRGSGGNINNVAGIPARKYADVAELADALDSGSSEGNFIWVQVPSSAPRKPLVSHETDGFSFSPAVQLPEAGNSKSRLRRDLSRPAVLCAILLTGLRRMAEFALRGRDCETAWTKSSEETGLFCASSGKKMRRFSPTGSVSRRSCSNAALKNRPMKKR